MDGHQRPIVINKRPVAGKRPETGPAPVVLIVDEDSAVRRLLEIALRDLDFDVCSAASATEAMAIYGLGGIDLVLLDVRSPTVDGSRTLVQLKEIDAEVVCCFMSARTGRDDLGETLSLGARGFLPKPFKLEELRKLVMEATRSSGAPSV